MSSSVSQPVMKPLQEVIDVLVENRIELDAIANVLKEINPMLHERYLGEIESLRRRKAPDLKQVLTESLQRKLRKRQR